MTAPVDRWELADIPDQAGRTVVVTGPSVGGLGFFTGLELARRGARVVLAGRDPAKLAESAAAIRAEHPAAALEELELDLASFASVRRAADAAAAYGPLDALVNNAGVMAAPRRLTDDGLDRQLQTNFFGPFLLTGLLLPQLAASGAGRVVAVSSIFHRLTRSVPLAGAGTTYPRWRGYFQSKLADLMATYELERRLRETELPVKALAAHPGSSATHLAANGQFSRSRGGLASILDATVKAVLQPAAHGAWPLLMATTADLPGATYVGPDGLLETRGRPRVVDSTGTSKDRAAQRELWELAERTTGLSYP